jgi:hypothetical protein
MSLLLARNRHTDAVAECPMLRDQRTWLGLGSKCEIDPMQTALERRQQSLLFAAPVGER